MKEHRVHYVTDKQVSLPLTSYIVSLLLHFVLAGEVVGQPEMAQC